jgi:hypothetical protein
MTSLSKIRERLERIAVLETGITKHNDSADETYDPRQHAMLIYCSFKGDLFLCKIWGDNQCDEQILMAGSNLQEANLKNANLKKC